jgi:hypothetical protein
VAGWSTETNVNALRLRAANNLDRWLPCPPVGLELANGCTTVVAATKKPERDLDRRSSNGNTAGQPETGA